jgi:hypothetical protein
VKCAELRRFYVKQIESGDVGDFDRKSEEELRQLIAEQETFAALQSERETRH